jgi:hypothetical protein
MIGAIAPIMWPHVIPYSYTKHSFQHWSNFKRDYTSFYITTLSRVPLLCRVPHCFVVRPTTLLWYSLLRRGFHYSAMGSATPLCVPPIQQPAGRLGLCQ